MDHAGSDREALARTAQHLGVASTLAETLEAIVLAARWSIPGADYVGISTAYPDGRLETIAATGPRVREIEELQSECGEGPGVHAVVDETITFAPDLTREERWPAYVRAAVARGLRGQIGVRLWADEHSRAGLDVYSERAGALSEASVHTADLFASQASLALGKARMHDQLQDAMQSRQDIGAAVGLVMAEHRITRAQAFAFLARISQNTNTKLRDVAATLVTEYEATLGAGA